MKFMTDDDAKLFLIEVGKIDEAVTATKDYEPADELVEELVRKRGSLIGSLKDHRKGQEAKSMWRANRHKMMRGIKAYHKSTEGKRFHRNLGNFLATRITNRKPFVESMTGSMLFETLKGISSARTHMYIELQFYHQVFEQAELEDMAFNYVAPSLKAIEEKVITRTELSEDDYALLTDITDKTSIISALVSQSNESLEEAEDQLTAFMKTLNLT